MILQDSHNFNAFNHSTRNVAAKGELNALLRILELVLLVLFLALAELNAAQFVPVEQRYVLSHGIQPKGAHHALDRVLVVEMMETFSKAGGKAANEEGNIFHFLLGPGIEGNLIKKLVYAGNKITLERTLSSPVKP